MIVLALCAELVLVLFPVIEVPTKHPGVVKLLCESLDLNCQAQVQVQVQVRSQVRSKISKD